MDAALRSLRRHDRKKHDRAKVHHRLGDFIWWRGASRVPGRRVAAAKLRAGQEQLCRPEPQRQAEPKQWRALSTEC